MISSNQCSAPSVELPKRQKSREVFVDPSNGQIVIDGGPHGFCGRFWPDVAGFGRIWPLSWPNVASFLASLPPQEA